MRGSNGNSALVSTDLDDGSTGSKSESTPQLVAGVDGLVDSTDSANVIGQDRHADLTTYVIAIPAAKDIHVSDKIAFQYRVCYDIDVALTISTPMGAIRNSWRLRRYDSKRYDQSTRKG